MCCWMIVLNCKCGFGFSEEASVLHVLIFLGHVKVPLIYSGEILPILNVFLWLEERLLYI